MQDSDPGPHTPAAEQKVALLIGYTMLESARFAAAVEHLRAENLHLRQKATEARGAEQSAVEALTEVKASVEALTAENAQLLRKRRTCVQAPASRRVKG